MSDSLEQSYSSHHDAKRRVGFAVLESERGMLFNKLIGTGKKVLDLGCRDGVITQYFAKGNTVTGVDIDRQALAVAQRNLNINTLNFDVQADQWPINPSSFDVVVAGELLEHVYFPEEMLKKIAQTLEPGGLFIGSVPNAFALKNRLKYLLAIKQGTPLADPMHINQFSWGELRTILVNHFTSCALMPLGNKYLGLTNLFPAWLGYAIAFSCKK